MDTSLREYADWHGGKTYTEEPIQIGKTTQNSTNKELCAHRKKERIINTIKTRHSWNHHSYTREMENATTGSNTPKTAKGSWQK